MTRSGPRGTVLAPKRGKVLDLPDAVPSVHRTPTLPKGLLLAAALVLFGQSFQYVVDVPPLYLLTKMWPLLMLPLALIGLTRLDLPYRHWLLVTLAWVLFVGPFMGLLVLNIDPLAAIASTAKVWALASGFALPVVLAWLRPSPATLARVVLALGAATLATFVLLWFAPDRLYHQDIDDTKIFIWDMERGKHLYVPLFVGLLALFHVARSWRQRPSWWKPVVVVVSFAVLILLYKVRLPIAAAGLAIVAGQLLGRPLRVVRLAVVIPLGIALAVPALLYVQSDGFAGQLGNSLSVRAREVQVATRFLDSHPIGWVTGVGSATRVGSPGLGKIVGDDYFFLADLGWLGVLFEYGAIGALLLAGLLALTLQITWRASADGDPLTGMLFDYTVWFAVASLTTPIVFAPGELMVCLALAVYLQRRRSEHVAAEQIA